MILLDTDHVNVLQDQQTSEYATLMRNISASLDQDLVTSVVSFEEQMRGWLALINRHADVAQQVYPYDRLNTLVQFFCQWTLLPFDDAAASQFKLLRGQKIRIGSMDLKIASIALERNLLVLSANLRDFQQVPNLRVEDWIH
ncbi:MAG TPA: type II toxin-antitoxin system VapC family toxin [Gemmataceae bacterium]|nr:type II toxin-antitoxin system VapC family toxin [Gemmataceae bacterium]